jgi:hypothetical protein
MNSHVAVFTRDRSVTAASINACPEPGNRRPAPVVTLGVNRKVLLRVGGVGFLALLILGYEVNSFAQAQKKAAAFKLPAASASASSSSTPVTPAPTAGLSGVQAACGSRYVRNGNQDPWVTVAGSEAGYRAHEKIQDIQLPHEAVARTDHVAGQVAIVRDGSTVQIRRGCFAVELGSLTSIDTLPFGVPGRKRDELYGDILSTGQYPYALLNLRAASIPMFGSQARTVRVPAELTIKETTRPVTLTVSVQLAGEQVQGVGSMAINANDFGVQLPDGPFNVDPKLTIEFLFFLERVPDSRSLGR